MANDTALDSKTLIQTAFPRQPTVAFFTAIVVGLLLLASCTVFRGYFTLNGTHSNLVLCLGVALVLAAFGGQATVRIGGVIMAGVAGLALGLFIYLHTISESLFLRGTVHAFDYSRYDSLDMKVSNRVLGRISQNDRDLRRSTYDFVLFKSEIDGQFIEIGLTERLTKAERVLSVAVADVEWAFGERRKLEWELREVGDEQGKLLTLVERFRKKEVAREGVVGQLDLASHRPTLGWTSVAYAAERSEQINVSLMLERLKSDDATTRRDARDALGRASIDDVPAMMQALERQAGDYRVKLGVCAAMVQILRADPGRVSAVARKLNNEHLDRLIGFAGDSDRTVRVYATELLVLLADQRASAQAIRLAGTTTDDNARYNFLLIAQAGWPRLSAPERQQLAGSLDRARRASGAKTRPLIDSLKF